MTAILLALLMCSGDLSAYSVLTHEEIVDLLWTDEIQPLLLKRFPALSPDQLREAHAYAYGGAVIQDLGYYPFESKEFSNLVHCVRSGDFVRELVLESQDVDEYAFALGALSHYASDIAGHPAVSANLILEEHRSIMVSRRACRAIYHGGRSRPPLLWLCHPLVFQDANEPVRRSCP